MNRTTLIATVTTLVALAGAGSAFAVEGTQDFNDTPVVSTTSRADVIREARAGLDQVEGEASAAPMPASTLSRAQVVAEAREAVRLGVAGSDETGTRITTPEQLESIRLAGLRAVGGTSVAGNTR